MENKNRLLPIIILAVVCGLGAGIVGELVSRTYFFGDFFNASLFGSVDIKNGQNGSSIVIQNARNVIVQQEIKAEETIDSSRASIVGIFKKINQTEATDFLLGNFYNLNDELGQGIIVTSDGWILTNALPLGLTKAQAEASYTVIGGDKEVFAVDNLIYDSSTGYYFLHLKDARNLTVKEFGQEDSIKNGKMVLAVAWNGSSEISFVSKINSGESLIKSSEALSDTIDLSQPLSADSASVCLVDLEGEIIGLVDKNLQVKPIYYFSNVIKSVLEKGEIKRPVLGINYINLKDLSGNGVGAMIYKDAKGVAVLPNSPAAQAGLAAGDTIISVGNQELNKDNNLTGILNNYQSGDSVSLVYKRGSENKEVVIQL